MCCTRLDGNTGRKNRHLRTIAQLYRAVSSQLRHVLTVGEKLVKQQYVLHMSPQYGELRPTNGWDRFGSLGHPSKTGFAFWLRYCSDVAHRKPTKLCTMFGRFLGWCTIYTFSGALAPERILPAAKFTLRSSLVFSYIGSVTARHSSSGRQPNFAASYKEWNFRTFAEGATYIRQGGHNVGYRPTF